MWFHLSCCCWPGPLLSTWYSQRICCASLYQWKTQHSRWQQIADHDHQHHQRRHHSHYHHVHLYYHHHLTERPAGITVRMRVWNVKVEGSPCRWPQPVRLGFWLHRETQIVFPEYANYCGVGKHVWKMTDIFVDTWALNIANTKLYNHVEDYTFSKVGANLTSQGSLYITLYSFGRSCYPKGIRCIEIP